MFFRSLHVCLTSINSRYLVVNWRLTSYVTSLLSGIICNLINFKLRRYTGNLMVVIFPYSLNKTCISKLINRQRLFCNFDWLYQPFCMVNHHC